MIIIDMESNMRIEDYDRSVKAVHPYGYSRGYVRYSGTITRKDGAPCTEADLSFAREHLRTPGQSCTIRFDGNGGLQLRGICDSGD